MSLLPNCLFVFWCLQRLMNVFFNYQSPTFWYLNTVGTECLLIPAVDLRKIAIVMVGSIAHD